MGPLSDRFGRRPVLIDGMALYCIASVLAIYGVVVRDIAAGARAAGAWHLRHPRDCDLDRSRLLRRPPHGQRHVAGDDGLHRRAGDRAVVRSGGDAADAVARHLHRADAVRSAGADLERAADAGDPADVRAQVARDSRRARRLSSDRDQPPDPGLCAGGRRRAGLAVRFRVLVASRCSPKSTGSDITFRWRSQPSRSASPSPAFSMPVSSAGSACG